MAWPAGGRGGGGPAAALRLAKVRHFTPADVAAALARLRNKPRYDDGLDDVGVIGNDFPAQGWGRGGGRCGWPGPVYSGPHCHPWQPFYFGFVHF